MNAEIKVLQIIEKTAKNGAKYKEIWCAVTLGEGNVFVRKFVLF